MKIKGQIVGGGLTNISIRGKNNETLELGDLLVAEENLKSNEKNFTIFQVKDIEYKSQASQSTHELLSGLKIEGYGAGLEFMEPELRNYIIARAKALIEVNAIGKESNYKYFIKGPKRLPPFFNEIVTVNKNHLNFLKPEKDIDSLYLGKVRSGSEELDIDVSIDAEKSLTHHMLIPATTGRGKSNLVKIILWGLMDSENTGILVLDPHNEYYGADGKLGLKSHPKSKEKLEYYSAKGEGDPLIINVKNLHPADFTGIINISAAQSDALYMLHSKYKDKWIENIIRGVNKIKTDELNINQETFKVIQRKFKRFLKMEFIEDNFTNKSAIFSNDELTGVNTINNILNALKDGKIVIIDTSRISDSEELFIGSVISNKIFTNYKNYDPAELKDKPVISIVIEEAPRVLGKEVLEGNSAGNIYATIAREGRKFKIGLIAITQLASVIPRTILANMNTKIILGNEMAVERSALIDSAAQDLSEDNRIIASLDKGEAIVTSVFTKFAIPIKIPLFNSNYVKEYEKNNPESKKVEGKPSFPG